MTEIKAIDNFNGIGPYRLTNFFKDASQESTCTCCGSALKNVFEIVSSDGQESYAGSSCILKVFPEMASELNSVKRTALHKAKVQLDREIREREEQEFLAGYKVLEPEIYDWLDSNKDTNDFALSLFKSLITYRKLTERQLVVVLDSISREKNRLVKEAKMKELGKLGDSKFLGKIKERLEFDCIVDKQIVIETPFNQYSPVFCINLFKDREGNVIVYKGSNLYKTEGEDFQFKASVKEHVEYKGVKQTIVQRIKETGTAVDYLGNKINP